MSERNKTIVNMYVNGTSYKVISEKFGITINRIAAIVASYIGQVYAIKQETEGEKEVSCRKQVSIDNAK